MLHGYHQTRLLVRPQSVLSLSRWPCGHRGEEKTHSMLTETPPAPPTLLLYGHLSRDCCWSSVSVHLQMDMRCWGDSSAVRKTPHSVLLPGCHPTRHFLPLEFRMQAVPSIMGTGRSISPVSVASHSASSPATCRDTATGPFTSHVSFSVFCSLSCEERSWFHTSYT